MGEYLVCKLRSISSRVIKLLCKSGYLIPAIEESDAMCCREERISVSIEGLTSTIMGDVHKVESYEYEVDCIILGEDAFRHVLSNSYAVS